MKQSFLTNLLFIVVINLVVKPLYLLGVEVEVQNQLGADVYGLYFALLNSAFLLQIINDFGLQIFNNRQVSMDRSHLLLLFPGFFTLKLVLSISYIVLLYLLGLFLGFSQDIALLLMIGFNLVLTSFVLFFRSGISGLGYYRIDSALSVLDKFLMLCIIGATLWMVPAGRFTMYHFVFGQMAALSLTMGLAFILQQHYSPVRFSLPFTRQLWLLTRKAAPYALAVFLMTLYTRLDGVMLVKLLPDGEFEAGIYAAGYRILDALNMIAFLFAVLLLPMFSRAQDKPIRLRTLVDEGFRYMWLLVVPTVVIGIAYRKEIILLLYDDANTYWATVFAILIFNFLLIGMMYVFGTLLTALGQIRLMNLIFAITLLLNIILNFLLIPAHKAAGAAIATLITQFIAVAGILFLSVHKAHIPFSLRYTLAFVLFAACVTGAGFLLQQFDVLSVLWSIVVFAVFTLVAAMVFRIARFSDVKSFRQND